MAEQLNEFLAKIQKEAVGKAQELSDAKIGEAKKEASRIVAEAEAKAAAIVAEAEAKSRQFAENGEKTLKYAARDVLIYTRQELEGLMKKVFAEKAASALTEEAVKPLLVKVLSNLEGECCVGAPEGADCAGLEQYFLKELAGKAKVGVKVCPVKGLKAGMTVTCKGQDVKVELTDETLVELLGSQLTEKLARLLKD